VTSGWQPRDGSVVRVGLIGLGSMGHNHLRVLENRPDVELVAFADPVAETRAMAGGLTSARPFADPFEMLAAVALDAVVVASPTTTHGPLALAAIARSTAVLVEKPLTATVEEGMAVVEAARRSGVPVAAGHVERFNPAVRELGRLLSDGWLSTVYSIACRRAGPLPARIRDVGVTVDLATHDLDIICWIARERPVRVYAETARRVHGQHEDLLFGLLHFASGATGMLDVNWLTPDKRRLLVVVGEEGMFELDYLTQRLTFTRSADTTRPRLIAGFAPTYEGEAAVLPVETTEPLALEIDDFLAVVRTGRRPLVDAVDGLWAVALAEALLTSARQGQPVDLADTAARLAVA
jgi:predicted dehydrogenase